jgi:hypothetical protein
MTNFIGDEPLVRRSPAGDEHEPERGGQEKPAQPVRDNGGDDRGRHDSIVAPVCQDLLDLGIAKAEEAQGGTIILFIRLNHSGDQ